MMRIGSRALSLWRAARRGDPGRIQTEALFAPIAECFEKGRGGIGQRALGKRREGIRDLLTKVGHGGSSIFDWRLLSVGDITLFITLL